ncbi:MAG: thiamine pyrophosphate-binding protein [Candidatus Binatia bacterium]
MEKISASGVIFEILRAEGVRHIFGNPGSTETPFLDGLVKYRDLEYVLGLHESAVVAMADGYARATGRPSAVSIHAAPGTANALGSLYNAMRDRTPMVVMAGQQSQRLLAQEPPLAGDTVRMTRSVVKWSWELSNGLELPTILRRAFSIARRPPCGPVFLSLPKDVLEQEIAFSRQSYRVTEDRLIAPAPDEVRKSVELLVQAKNPVIIAGPGLSTRDAWKPLAEIAERLGAPIYANPVGFPGNHPQVCGLIGWDPPSLKKSVAGADLVLIAGYRMFVNDPLQPLLEPGVSVVHYDDDAAEIDKNVPAAAGVVGELALSLGRLSEILKDQLKGRENEFATRREKTLSAAAAVWSQAEASLRARWEQVPIAPARVVAALAAALPENAVIVDEAVRASGYVKQHYHRAGPGRYYYYDGGALGWGLGTAVGMQLALPDRRVVSILGDGAASFGIHALWTAARLKLPVLVVVLDNHSYAAVVAALVDYKGEALKRGVYPGCDVEGIEFPALAAGFGVQARSVSNPDELEPALRWALNVKGPSLVHVNVDPFDLGPGHPGRPRRGL